MISARNVAWNYKSGIPEVMLLKGPFHTKQFNKHMCRYGKRESHYLVWKGLMQTFSSTSLDHLVKIFGCWIFIVQVSGRNSFSNHSLCQERTRSCAFCRNKMCAQDLHYLTAAACGDVWRAHVYKNWTVNCWNKYQFLPLNCETNLMLVRYLWRGVLLEAEGDNSIIMSNELNNQLKTRWSSATDLSSHSVHLKMK